MLVLYLSGYLGLAVSCVMHGSCRGRSAGRACLSTAVSGVKHGSKKDLPIAKLMRGPSQINMCLQTNQYAAIAKSL